MTSSETKKTKTTIFIDTIVKKISVKIPAGCSGRLTKLNFSMHAFELRISDTYCTFRIEVKTTT